MMFKKLVTAVSILVLSACGGGGGSSQLVGTFIDDPVGGLAYSCVSASQTITGTTNDQGQFSYAPGQTCTFKVGNVTIGSIVGVPADGKVTPQDVAGVSRGATSAPSALAIAQFLQSLNDGSSSGKIVIPTATSDALKNAPAITLVTSTGSVSQADLQNLVVTVAGKTLVSASAAQGALDKQIASGVVDKTQGAVAANAPVTLNSIAVTSANASNAAGLTEQLTATGYYSDGTTKDLTALATWSTADSATVTVDATGLAKGLKKGTATVTASYTPASSSTAIKGTFDQGVLDPTALNLAISFVNSTVTSIQNTASAVMQAILTFTDSSIQYVSNAVSWVVSSVNGGSATIDKTTDTSGKTATITGTKEGLLSIVASYLNGDKTITSNALALTVTPLSTLKGVAASGVAMSNATVSAMCTGSSTPVTATANSDGSYSMTFPVGVYAPCLVSATTTDLTGKTQTFYSTVASDTSSSNAVANITPITQLIVAAALGSEPTSATALSSVADKLNTTNLNSSTTLVQTGLSGSLGVPSDAIKSPLNDSIAAASLDSGVNSNPQDSAIDRIMSLLNVASTSISKLAALFTTGSVSNIASSVTSFATANGVPTSGAAGCPSAISGLYATANIGATNLKNGKPDFGALKIDFATNTAVNGSGDSFTITPDKINPCRFTVASSTKSINFEVSRSGFIVATSFAPPDASATTASMMPAGTSYDCFKPNSYCSGFSIGIPVQTGITLNDAVGNWQTVEWNLNKYTHQKTKTVNSVTVADNTSEHPCSAGLSSGSPSATSDPDWTCSLYTSYFHKFVISAPNNGSSALGIYGCDGLYQGANTAKKCSSTLENSSVALTMVMCSVNNDCPTVSYIVNGTTVNSTLTSVMDVMAGTTVVGRGLAFRSTSNELIGMFVSGPGGPPTTDNAHSAFNNVQFQEQFGVFFRPAGAAVAPLQDSVITRGQWTAVDWKSNIATAKISGTSMTNVSLSNSNSNLLTTGQVLMSPGLRLGTTITAINNGTYTLVCGTNTDCRTQTTNPNVTTSNGITNYANVISAVSQQIKEQTQIYKVSSVSNNVITRNFTNAIDANGVDVVKLDTPYVGMTYRAYVASTSNSTNYNESVSIRGSGFAVSAGTATLAQQLGGIPTGGTIATGCTMPGQVYSIANNSCSGTSTTGRFFTINLNY